MMILRRSPLLLRLWIGALISGVGDHLAWMGVIWLVLDQTGSGASVGTAMLCFALPAVFTGAGLGRLLDKIQPRIVMIADNLARAVVFALIVVLSKQQLLSLPTLYGLIALAGALAPATQVGTNVLLGSLLSEKDREEGNAAFGLTGQIATMFGPLLAGLVIAEFGAITAFGLDALSFFVMAIALRSVPNIAREPAQKVRRSLLLLRNYPAVIVITLLSTVFFFAYGPTEAALALFVRDRLHADARGLGALWSSVGIGALLGSLLLPLLTKKLRIGVALALVMILWGGFQALLSQTTLLPIAMLCFFFGGIAWGPYLPLQNMLCQKIIKKNELGTVLGLQSAWLAPTLPLGTALGGLLLKYYSGAVIVCASGLVCVAAGLIALCLPVLQKLRIED
jgi:predicted MFS family arabinose efflux permease